MELLIAFLIAFGVVSSGDAKKLTQSDAEYLVKTNNLDGDYLIWEAEADDF